MGMFDTVQLDRAYTCPGCQGTIHSVQVKAFENQLETFRTKDCTGHAEEVRIIKEELFCDRCREDIGKSIYIVEGRGILLGITDSLEEAQRLLNDLNQEKLVLWYHDLYHRYIAERREKHSYQRFLEDLGEWYGERLYEYVETDSTTKVRFIWNSRHLMGTLSPVESIERFMTYKKMIKVLDELREEGYEILDIYYAEEIDSGEDEWSVDVYQDEVNERCHLNWTWTVMSRKQLAVDREEESDLPEWVIVVEEPFSDAVVCKAIERWLLGRGYDIGVRMVPFEEAGGSGLIRKLMEMDIESEMEQGVSIEDMEKELEEAEGRRLSDFIERVADKRKVFYYEGFYGSLVPDVESDRLLGRIEGIAQDIVYEGKTVRVCEQRFREAVFEYKKG
uniref:Uncharacterized protein n=1 Tax=Candidatus Methanogaster sp. ANME-2c ERB4 TaxID=2759911 RepID=A0A7G9XZT8_9EURY|nr:hypothetical protein BHHPIBDN_00002 [Methanosarcinales archaeon ANME-2c ERB4]